MGTFSLNVITPLGVKFDGEATSVTAPGTHGYLGILANHAPMMSTLQAGVLTIEHAGGKLYFAMRTGAVEVHDNKVDILCDRAIEADSQEAAAEQVREFLAHPSEFISE